MSQRALFPTLVHTARIDPPDLVADLEDACWMLEDGDQAGHDWCARQGYPGYTSYASLDDLVTRASAGVVFDPDADDGLWMRVITGIDRSIAMLAMNPQIVPIDPSMN